MSKGLRLSLGIADGAMLIYWAIAALACAGLFRMPAAMMYDGYGTPLIDAWNWSFAPIDLAFAIAGLASVVLARRGDPRWRALALISLALGFCAGLMAISFWALKGEYNLAWWIPNFALVAIALWWGPRLALERPN